MLLTILNQLEIRTLIDSHTWNYAQSAAPPQLR